MSSPGSVPGPSLRRGGLGGTAGPSACVLAAALPTRRPDTSWPEGPVGGADRAGIERVPATPPRPARGRVAGRGKFSSLKPPPRVQGGPRGQGGQRHTAGRQGDVHVRPWAGVSVVDPSVHPRPAA